MLNATRALELAAGHQRRALRDAAAHAAALGEPVGFLCRPAAAGTTFEAVALESARTCAVVDARGALRFIGGPAARGPVSPPRYGAGVRRAAAAALVTAARPRA